MEQLRFHEIFMNISSTDTYIVFCMYYQKLTIFCPENSGWKWWYPNRFEPILETSGRTVQNYLEISKIILRFRKYQSVIMKEFATWKYLILSEIVFVTKLNGAKTLKFHTIPCCYYGWKWVYIIAHYEFSLILNPDSTTAYFWKLV